MNHHYIMFCRAGVYYSEDTITGKQISLRTKDESEARTLLHCKNEAQRQPGLNRQIARVYLRHSDPLTAVRTWQHVMDEIIKTKSGENQIRWQVVAKSKKYDALRSRLLIET